MARRTVDGLPSTPEEMRAAILEYALAVGMPREEAEGILERERRRHETRISVAFCVILVLALLASYAGTVLADGRDAGSGHHADGRWDR